MGDVNLNLNVVSFNVRGIASIVKRNTIFTYLKHNFKGIIFLQETHSCQKTQMVWKRETRNDWEIHFSHGTSGSKGVAILIPKTYQCKINTEIADPSGRFLLLDVEIDETSFILLNVYAPTKDKPHDQKTFLDNIKTILRPYIDRKMVIAGDHNVCLNPKMDKKGGKGEKESEYARELIQFMEENDLVDIWRVRHPDKKQYTRRQNCKAGIVHSRLDSFLVSAHMAQDIEHTDIKPSIFSDHSLIQISIITSVASRHGKGFFKFNTSLLKDDQYVSKVKECIGEFVKENDTVQDKCLFWDLLKCKIRGMTISHASHKARERRNHEMVLSKQIEHMENMASLSDNAFTEYQTLKKDYDDIQKEKANGVMVRSRADYVEFGEKNTKYFLGLEKRNQKIKHIRCLINDNQDLIYKPNDILGEQNLYYERLYTETDPNRDGNNCCSDFLENPDIPKLTQNHKEACDMIITLEECGLALKQLASNKSPGSDGFSPEFYKFFWPDIRTHLFASYDYSFKSGKLSIDQRRGILSLIPKKDKDLRYLKNWRPLSLLNTDYKILTKLLANRMQCALDKIISHDQSGYIKGRYIGENVRLISDIISFTDNDNKQPGIIALLDFEKAFDTISWQFLERTLTTFNFGEHFRKWIQILYNDISSCCLNNGHATSFFKITRGIRQGCPISALLFILVVETLACKIRSSKDIVGISVDEREIKISQLADDTTLFLKDHKALACAFELLENFYTCSGLKLNKTKTEIFYLGNTNHRPTDQVVISTSFKALGIYFCKSTDEMIKKNLDERCERFQNILNIWSQRDLSLKGKITILKSLAIPQLLYVTNVICVPDRYIEMIDKAITHFLWNGKPPKIKQTTVIADIKNGGLKLPHFRSMFKSQKITWIKRLVDQKNSNWKILAWNLLGLTKNELFSKLSLAHVQNRVKSPFYRQLIDTWYSFYSVEPEKARIYEERLWNNRFILVDKHPILYKQWLSHGIKHLQDLYHDALGLLGPDALSRKFNLHINKMAYNSLIHAIPSKWKHVMLNNNHGEKMKDDDLTITVNGERIGIESVKSHMLYWHLVNKITKPPTAIDKWVSEFVFLNDDDFANFFQLPYKVLRDTKMQTFQYTILHKIIPCGAALHTWKLADNSNCIYCADHDSVPHFFFDCSVSKEFWDNVSTWIFRTMSMKIPITKIDVLFGIPVYDQFLMCINFIILYGKWHIYVCKKNGKRPFIFEFLIELKNAMTTERCIMIMRDSVEKFKQKWSLLYDALF